MTNPVPDTNDAEVPRMMYALGIYRGLLYKYETSLTANEKMLLATTDEILTELYNQRLKNLSQ